MATQYLHISRNSIRFKLVVGLLSVMLPLISFLIYNNFYAIRVVRNQVAESYKNMMTMYMNEIDNNLDSVDSYLSNLGVSNTDLRIMLYSTNENDYSLAKMRLYNKIKEDITMYRSIDSMYIYSDSKQDFIEIDNNGITYDKQDSIREHIANSIKQSGSSGKAQTPNWSAKKIGQEYYLFRILKIGDIYIGSWVNVKKLLIPLNMIDIGQEGVSLLSTDKGEPMMDEQIVRNTDIDLNLDFNELHLLGSKYKYLVVGEKSNKGNFNLISLIPDSKILEKLPYLQRWITIISVLLILLLPVTLLLLRKVTIIPLRRMLFAMKRIQEGDLEVRIEPYATSEEFQIVNNTFNKMMEQIHELKINVYEEKINRQKAELQHLQLQINPHFFLNSLNIIHTLARGKNFELIQEMTLCLIQYFRYMFRSNLTFVSLKDELQHVRNYIRIQELRFPESLIYKINVPEFLLDKPVPPLIIHTFIENSIKYAVSRDEIAHLSVDIDLIDDRNVAPSFKITMQDNGNGFKEEVLSELRAGNRITDEQGEHIGIWNVQRRLSLLYKEHASFSIGNADPRGALVEITLPLNIDSLDSEE